MNHTQQMQSNKRTHIVLDVSLLQLSFFCLEDSSSTCMYVCILFYPVVPRHRSFLENKTMSFCLADRSNYNKNWIFVGYLGSSYIIKRKYKYKLKLSLSFVTECSFVIVQSFVSLYCLPGQLVAEFEKKLLSLHKKLQVQLVLFVPHVSINVKFLRKMATKLEQVF